LFSTFGCAGADGAGTSLDATKKPSARVEMAAPIELTVEVLAEYPHDPQAYTQGLIYWQGVLIESTGRFGESDIRRYRPGDEPELIHPLDEEVFGEGVTRIDDRLLQLTWKSGRAYEWDLATLDPIGERRFKGEGWGLEYTGKRLVMSDGTHVLQWLDPTTLERQARLRVTRFGSPMDRLNELEWVGDDSDGELYANVYETDQIVRIDPTTGNVTATINAAGLLTDEEARRAEVLNGIAYRADTDSFFITGKLWPRIFEVRFVPVPTP
jgi:glutamine cyclotransferase